MLRGGPPPERPKIWYARRRIRYLILYLCFDHVTWYTYRLCTVSIVSIGNIFFYNCKKMIFFKI